MANQELDILEKKQRKFLPENLDITLWQQLNVFFQELKNRPINSIENLRQWLLDRSELYAIVSESIGWKYVKMTCNTLNKDYTEAYTFFVSEIEPNVASFNNDFNKKLISSPFIKNIENEGYSLFLREVKKDVELFREENIPLLTQLKIDSQKYAAITAAMTVEVNGNEITMQKATNCLKNTDRKVRENVYRKIQERREQDEVQIDNLFTQLVEVRNKVATNAGFENFRDYMFVALGRFDYTVKDCYLFHDSIAQEIVPIVEKLDKERKQALNLEQLKPWDKDVDILGRAPLSSSKNSDDLIEKTITCLSGIRPYFGKCLKIMRTMGHLDLESKKGKAPGGYNLPLHETGVPFIFMNSVGSLRDMVIMLHESGHAIHSFLCRELEITDFKSTPSEVAELASMSMELISMEHWDIFFSNETDLKRAKKEHLEKILNLFTWIAAVDNFQHWIYTNPTHTASERTAEWIRIMKRFGSNIVDWTGCEDALGRTWQNQLHIFELPFYYIEYGIAQLGAIAVWRNYKKNPEKALDAYQNALKLGYTEPIAKIYETAGIKFDFSSAYVKELIDFVKAELAKVS